MCVSTISTPQYSPPPTMVTQGPEFGTAKKRTKIDNMRLGIAQTIKTSSSGVTSPTTISVPAAIPAYSKATLG